MSVEAGYSALFIVPRSGPAPLTANFREINEIARIKDKVVAQLRITVRAEHRHRKGDIYVDRPFS
jgi:hypothetical protein